METIATTLKKKKNVDECRRVSVSYHQVDSNAEGDFITSLTDVIISLGDVIHMPHD